VGCTFVTKRRTQKGFFARQKREEHEREREREREGSEREKGRKGERKRE